MDTSNLKRRPTYSMTEPVQVLVQGRHYPTRMVDHSGPILGRAQHFIASNVVYLSTHQNGTKNQVFEAFGASITPDFIDDAVEDILELHQERLTVEDVLEYYIYSGVTVIDLWDRFKNPLNNPDHAEIQFFNPVWAATGGLPPRAMNLGYNERGRYIGKMIPIEKVSNYQTLAIQRES